MKENKMLNGNDLKECFRAFVKNDNGAVTVDFVVLTAGIVVLGTIATVALAPKVTAVVTGITL